MKDRREIVHTAGDADQWYFSKRVSDLFPFSSTLFREGGYGLYRPGFWVERPAMKGFSTIIISFAGKGHFKMEDGEEVILDEGSIFISSPKGQWHREETIGSEPWEHVWLSFFASSSLLPTENFDWKILKTSETKLYRELTLRIIREDLHTTSDSTASIELCENLILLTLRRTLRSSESAAAGHVKSQFEQLWNTVSGSLNQEWNVERLCSEMNYSRSQLTRLCRGIYGQSPGEKIKAMRMEHAKLLLANTQNPIIEIAETVGYTSPSLFSTAFSNHVGMSPREYRKGRKLI